MIIYTIHDLLLARLSVVSIKGYEFLQF